MKVRLKKLTLFCRKSVEEIDLDHDVVTFLGSMNTGKSSALHLIDFCLGANNPYETEALRKELLSVRLELQIEGVDLIVERERSARVVSAAWRFERFDAMSAILPLQVSAIDAGLSEQVRTLSDLLFYLAGLDLVKVRKAPSDPDSDLIRLSFRDLMFYCFVQQRYSDSNFFRLDDLARLKSRDAIRFVCGYYSARLAQLELRLDELRRSRETSELSLTQLSTVLKAVSGGDDMAELIRREAEVQEELSAATQELAHSNERYEHKTHITDDLRAMLRELSASLDTQERAVARQAGRLEELVELRAEFYSLKFKTERSQVAQAVLGNANYDYCPQCTRELDVPVADECALCKSDSEERAHLSPEFLEASRRDLNDRLAEVETTLKSHRESLSREQRRLDRIKARKGALDAELSTLLRRYDDDFLERFRRGEREKALLSGELKRLQGLINIHRNIEALRGDSRALDEEMRQVRRAIEDERKTLTMAQQNVDDIATAFLANLRAIGVPGVDSTDRAVINTRTWYPRIENPADPTDYWDFDSAGSNGRRVLFTVNYALAVHEVAERKNLPLPTLLLLDTPTKDVSKDVNPVIHDAMDARIYELSETTLHRTQLIVADGSFLNTPPDIDRKDYTFTRGHGLISYYVE